VQNQEVPSLILVKKTNLVEEAPNLKRLQPTEALQTTPINVVIKERSVIKNRTGVYLLERKELVIIVTKTQSVAAGIVTLTMANQYIQHKLLHLRLC
jgi:hypothetical protein